MRHQALLCLCAGASVGWVPFAVAQPTITKIAYQGDPAPGTTGAYTQFLGGFGIGAPVIDHAGNVAYRAFVNGGTAANDTATFVGPPGGVQLWAREGSTLLGAGGVFGQNSDNQKGYPLVSGGRVAMMGPTSAGLAVIVGPPGSAATLARPGLAAPGLPAGVTYGSFPSFLSISTFGQTAFVTTLSGGAYANRRALYSDHAGPLAPILIENTPAPGLSGQTLGPIFGVTFGPTGHVAAKVSTSTGHAIYSTHGGSLAPVAWTGMSIPAFGTLGTIADLSSAPAFNASGHVAFRGIAGGTYGHLANRSGTMQFIARTAMPIPGVPGSQFNSFDTVPPPVMNNAGDVAFGVEGWYSGFNYDTVFVSRPGGGQVIAREGDPTPLSPTVSFAAIAYDSVRINSPGEVAFIATLAGTGVTGANDRAIFVHTGVGGTLRTAIREGDVIDIHGDASLLRTVSSFEFSQANVPIFDPWVGPFGGAGAFNDAGTLAVLLNFTDGTQGIFAITVPPPPTCTGDVNGDNALDGFDVQCMEMAVGGDLSCFALADPDYNGDFALDGFDVEAVESVVGGGPCP